MNIQTALLAALVLIAAVVAGVWLNDRFNPTTPQERAFQRYQQKLEECRTVTGFNERMSRGCE